MDDLVNAIRNRGKKSSNFLDQLEKKYTKRPAKKGKKRGKKT